MAERPLTLHEHQAMGRQCRSRGYHSRFNGSRGVIHAHGIQSDTASLDQDAGLTGANELTGQ